MPQLILLSASLLEQQGAPLWRNHFPHAIILLEDSGLLGVQAEDFDLLLSQGLPELQTLKMIELACYRSLQTTPFAENNLAQGGEGNPDLHKRDDQLEQKANLQKLAEISISLSAEDDLMTLLRKILEEGQNIACCDAASLFLIDRDETESSDLIFKLTQNDSIDFPFEERRFPLNDQSLVGHVALSNCELNIDDVYNLPSEVNYEFNKTFDESTGYRTQSVYAIPLTDKKKSAIGVVQFINRKAHRSDIIDSAEAAATTALPFDTDINVLLQALASQAGIAIENTILQNEIKNLFEGFVNASVAAIEQRDPTTSGHSFRVADLCVTLADSVNLSDLPNLRRINYSKNEIQELRYAALLHDFGKVGVREAVLVKEKKLQAGSLESIRYRIEITKEQLQTQALREQIRLLRSGHAVEKKLAQVDEKLRRDIEELDEFYTAIVAVNEPSMLNQANRAVLERISQYRLNTTDTAAVNIVSEEEFQLLCIPKGSLSPTERKEIESHVVHTQNFLNHIPWTSEFKNIPSIAGAHHEKLDGSGYPNGMSADEIPSCSKIMTICDIYDALTASDRPYKPAMPLEKALGILSSEAKKGLLDADLVEVFIQASVFDCLALPDSRSKPSNPSLNGSQSSNHPCDPEFHSH